MSEERKPPVDRVRLDNLKATIWENTHDGRKSYSVQLSRVYRNQDGEYRDTDSFSAKDLLALPKLVDRAYERMDQLRQQQRQTKQPEQQPRRSRERDRDLDRER